MDYIFQPTLRHMCLVKIATQLWSRDDFPIKDGSFFSVNVLARALEKVQTLALPNRLKTELSVMLKPMEWDMLSWFRHLFTQYHVVGNNPRELRWTPQGTIDCGKSVEVILTTDQSLSLDKRLRLACNFCLVDQISILWMQLSLKEPNNSISHRNRFSSTFEAFYVAGDLPQVPPGSSMPGESITFPLKNAFITAIYNHNVVAAKYFFAKLSPEEVNEWVRSQLCYLFPFGSDLLCFMLSRMDQNQRLDLLTGRSSFLEVGNMLSLLLEWPYQGFFLEAVQSLWDYLSAGDFIGLSRRICLMINVDYERCTYRNILREFWQSSPNALKKQVIHKHYIAGPWGMLYTFFKFGEVEMFRLVLKEANAAEKERLVCVENAGNEILMPRTTTTTTKGLDKSHCTFFKFLLVECGASREKVDQFKAHFASPDLDMEDEDKKDILQFLEHFSSS